MFRLNDAISNWSSALLRTGVFSASQVEELSDHLYSEVQKQQALGVGDETAFLSAIERIGSVEALAREYSRNQRVRHALSLVANVPYGAQILGAYLVTVACLMCYSMVAAWFAYSSGQFTPPNTVPLLLVCAVLAAFGWSGFNGLQLMRGRAPSCGALVGLLALILVQVPIIGGFPASGFEFSGGLQFAVLFGPAEYRFQFQPGADVHINTLISAPYLGINLVALVAGIFVGLQIFDSWRNEAGRPARIATEA